MNKTIRPVNFDAKQSIIDSVNVHFDDLPNFHSGITSAEIYLKRLNEALMQIEINVFVSGFEKIFAEATGSNFLVAANETYEKIKSALLTASGGKK